MTLFKQSDMFREVPVGVNMTKDFKLKLGCPSIVVYRHEAYYGTKNLTFGKLDNQGQFIGLNVLSLEITGGQSCKIKIFNVKKQRIVGTTKLITWTQYPDN